MTQERGSDRLHAAARPQMQALRSAGRQDMPACTFRGQAQQHAAACVGQAEVGRVSCTSLVWRHPMCNVQGLRGCPAWSTRRWHRSWLRRLLVQSPLLIWTLTGQLLRSRAQCGHSQCAQSPAGMKRGLSLPCPLVHICWYQAHLQCGQETIQFAAFSVAYMYCMCRLLGQDDHRSLAESELPCMMCLETVTTGCVGSA